MQFFLFVTEFPAYMDRLLVFLFSITLVLATYPPRVSPDACDYKGGICVVKEICVKANSICSTSEEENSDCSKDSGCRFPICCVYGPCCCLCIIPECPVLHISPSLPEEERLKPNSDQDFFPQMVCVSIWKPPAFSV